MDSTPPARRLLGRYQLEERIGGGGMAEVFRATDLQLQRPVAVKIPHAYLAADPILVERLRQEARIVSTLEHPGIVKVYDYGEDEGQPFLVMELVPGSSLGELLAVEGPLPFPRVREIVLDLLSALEHAHSRGVLHRDIKPQNVLVTPEGSARLVDFGIAQASAAATVTSPGQVVGSVHYLAPERLTGQPATVASDLYAVGVLLYLLLAGRLPFEGDLAAVVAAQQQLQRPPPPSRWRSGLPEWMDGVVDRALAKDPVARYASAAEMSEDLRRLAAAAHEAPTVRLPISATPVEPRSKPAAGRAGRGGGRPFAIYGAILGLLLLATVSLVGAVRPGGDADSLPRASAVPTLQAVVAHTPTPTRTPTATPRPPTPTPPPSPTATPSSSSNDQGGHSSGNRGKKKN